MRRPSTWPVWASPKPHGAGPDRPVRATRWRGPEPGRPRLGRRAERSDGRGERDARLGPLAGGAGVLFALACGLVAWWLEGGWPATVVYELGGYGGSSRRWSRSSHHRPQPRWPWIVLTLGILGSATGDLLWDLTERHRRRPRIHVEGREPRVPRELPALRGGRARTARYPRNPARRPGADRGDHAGGAGWLVLWVLVVHPQLADGGLTSGTGCRRCSTRRSTCS